MVTFYARGGNLGGETNPIQTRDGTIIGGLSVLNFNTPSPDLPDVDAVKADLVAFLKSLTDERVRRAAAPFDRPQIFVPNGHPGNADSVTQRHGQAVDSLLGIPATGQTGGPVLGVSWKTETRCRARRSRARSRRARRAPDVRSGLGSAREAPDSARPTGGGSICGCSSWAMPRNAAAPPRGASAS